MMANILVVIIATNTILTLFVTNMEIMEAPIQRTQFGTNTGITAAPIQAIVLGMNTALPDPKWWTAMEIFTAAFQ